MRTRDLICFLALSVASVGAVAGETITVDGTTYEDAEMVEVGPDGAIYETEGGEYVTLPWLALSPAQVSAIKARFPEAIENAMFEAHFIKGTVFQATSDGVIIQIDIPEREKGPPAKNGAVVPTSGLVIVRDLPTSIPQGEGVDIEIKAYKRQSYTYDMGIAAKEIPLLTVARPIWGQEQEWVNEDGKKMYARLIAVKDGKGMFEKAGKTFVYELSKLDEDAQKRAAAIAEKLSRFPLP